jgi:hypothetical protein
MNISIASVRPVVPSATNAGAAKMAVILRGPGASNLKKNRIKQTKNMSGMWLDNHGVREMMSRTGGHIELKMGGGLAH